MKSSTLVSLVVCNVGSYLVVAVREFATDPIGGFHFLQVDNLYQYILLGFHC